MNLFLDNGYLDIESILNIDVPFIFVTGGRGTGKTFGALKHAIEANNKFILLRRTQSQLDVINKPEFSPFKSLNYTLDWNIGSHTLSKYNVGFYQMEKREDGSEKPQGPALGYSMALSTVANLRGFDGSDVELMIYDEFIPERHEKPLKNEGAALLNAYETINRNRELNGQKPMKLLALSNSNDLGNAIFLELGLVHKAEDMQRKGQAVSIMKDRGVALIILNKSPISDAKKVTALYKLAKDTEFSQMALNNTFAELKSRSIKSMPLSEYTAFVTVGEITIYKHKSGGKLYVSSHKTGSCPTYDTSEIERQRFARAYYWIWGEYLQDHILFEDSTCEVLLTKYYT